MASFFRYNLAKGFTVDRNEVQETARRQFVISAVIVAAALSIATAGSLRAIVSPTHQAAERNARVEYAAAPIKAHVRYVDRSSSDHRIAIAWYGELSRSP
jgi:hypothetical protein